MNRVARHFTGVLSVAVVALCSHAQPAREAPDLVIVGGKVFTSDTTRQWAEAIAIQGERITTVGTSAEVRRLAGPATRIIDVGGRVVVPGLNDAHEHLTGGNPGTTIAMGSEITNPSGAQVLDSLRAAVSRVPPGTWIGADIWTRALDDTALRRPALDRVAPTHPVALTSGWGHGMIVNSAAMRALRLRDNEPDPLGGWYERDRQDRLTGRLDEYAGWNARRNRRTLVPESTMVANLRRFAERGLQLGITTVQDMGLSFEPATQIRVLRAAQLPLRVHVYKHSVPATSSLNLTEWNGIPERPSPLVVVSGRKWILDGTPLDGLALTRRPQDGRPGWHGRFDFPVDSVRRMLADAVQKREQLALHVIGDSAVAIVVRLMDAVAPDSVWRSLRLRFEHGGIIGTPDLWSRAASKGVVVAVNLQLLPPPNVARTLPKPVLDAIASGFDSTVVSRFSMALGSDGVSRSPFVGMYTALSFPADRHPSRELLVRAYTLGSAYAEFAEREKGSIRAGMLADIAVLSQDIFTVPVDALPRTESVMTLVGGKIVWDAGVLR